MKVVFVHGALVFDGVWWWHRMVGPLAALGLGSLAVELPSCVAPRSLPPRRWETCTPTPTRWVPRWTRRTNPWYSWATPTGAWS